MHRVLPDATTSVRIVVQKVGPTTAIHLRHVSSDWVIVTTGRGLDLATSVDKLRQEAVRRGYEVEAGFTTEDWNATIAGMLKS